MTIFILLFLERFLFEDSLSDFTLEMVNVGAKVEMLKQLKIKTQSSLVDRKSEDSLLQAQQQEGTYKKHTCDQRCVKSV